MLQLESSSGKAVEGKFLYVPFEHREATVVSRLEFLTAEVLVKDYILPGIIDLTDCKRNPGKIAEIRAYLNSKAAEQDPNIPQQNLRQMQQAFELPGLIGQTQVRLEEVQTLAAAPEDLGCDELLEDLLADIFHLETILEPGLKRSTFDAKTQQFSLADLAALFQNIKAEFKTRETQQARESSRGQFAKIFSFLERLVTKAKRQN